MSPSRQTAYPFLLLAALLFVAYAAAALLGAVKFLTPSDPLAITLPYNQVAALANALLNLSIMSGLLGGGLYVAASDGAPLNEQLIRYAFAAWALLTALVVAAGLLGLMNNGDLPPLLALVQVIIVLAVLALVAPAAARLPVIQVWAVGLGVSALCSLWILLSGEFAPRLLAAGLRLNVGYALGAVALGFWLMHRFSNVTPAWADTGIYSVAGLVTLAGVWVSLPPLYPLGAPDWARTVGSIGVVVVPILYLIFAAHSYRALSDRNGTYTLAGHWFSLGVLLFLLGPGLLGALNAAPGVAQWTAGTRLTDLQNTLAAFAVLALCLGVVNQAAAELRGHNRRVTGLTPFWLVAFGILGGGLALGGAGVVQTFMERASGVGYLDVQTLVTPLYAGWVVGLLALALGAGIYGLTLWLRPPEQN
jgi:hypothetical protein